LQSRVNFRRGVYSIEHLLKPVLLSLRCPSNVGTFSSAKSGHITLRFIAVVDWFSSDRGVKNWYGIERC
jgi:hypothetical protein